MLVCVIVCLSIASALVTATTQSALRLRRQARVERQLRQAEWLLEAGARQAVARIAQSAVYKGEVWLLDQGALPGSRGARIAIEVAKTKPRQPHRIRITAELATDDERPLRRSDEFIVRRDERPKSNEE